MQNVFFYCETKSQQYQLNSEAAVSLFLSTEAIGSRVRRRIISVLLVNLYQIYLSYILLNGNVPVRLSFSKVQKFSDLYVIAVVWHVAGVQELIRIRGQPGSLGMSRYQQV